MPSYFPEKRFSIYPDSIAFGDWIATAAKTNIARTIHPYLWAVSGLLTASTFAAALMVPLNSAAWIYLVLLVGVLSVIGASCVFGRKLSPHRTLTTLLADTRLESCYLILSLGTLLAVLSTGVAQMVFAVASLIAAILTLHATPNAIRLEPKIDRTGQRLAALINDPERGVRNNQEIMSLVKSLVKHQRLATTGLHKDHDLALSCSKWLRAAIVQETIQRANTNRSPLSISNRLTTIRDAVFVTLPQSAREHYRLAPAKALVQAIEDGEFRANLSRPHTA